MNAYHLVSNMPLAELEGKNVVKAEELWELLRDWGARLRPSHSETAIEVAADITAERLSLHCEPEVFGRVCYRGRDIDEMSESEAKEALISIVSGFSGSFR